MMPPSLNDWQGGEALQGFSWKTEYDHEGRILSKIQSGPFAKKMTQSFREVTLTLAQEGHLLLIDDVSFGSKEVNRWRNKLDDFIVLWAGISSPVEVIEAREKARENRMPGSGRHQHLTVHHNVTYDLEINTHDLGIGESARAIEQLVSPQAILRSFTLEDLDSILLLFYDIVHALGPEYSQEELDAWAPRTPDRQAWLTSLEKTPSLVVETQGSSLLGFGNLSQSGHLDHLYVHKEYHHRGIASRILEELEALSRSMGITQWTTESSIVAKPFFEARGFVVTNIEEKEVRGTSFTLTT